MKFYKSGLTNLKRNKMNYIARGCMYCEGICNKECLPKQETVEDAEWMQERMYSEEELKSAFKIGFNIGYGSPVQELDLKNEHCERWFNQFKKK
ncbi:MAG: hypothetical protein K9I82_01720 [Chitinophagaceae bacterium]|nr:hypothetical protein [Chitinophagaceae bacterium]